MVEATRIQSRSPPKSPATADGNRDDAAFPRTLGSADRRQAHASTPARTRSARRRQQPFRSTTDRPVALGDDCIGRSANAASNLDARGVSLISSAPRQNCPAPPSNRYPPMETSWDPVPCTELRRSSAITCGSRFPTLAPLLSDFNNSATEGGQGPCLLDRRSAGLSRSSRYSLLSNPKRRSGMRSLWRTCSGTECLAFS